MRRAVEGENVGQQISERGRDLRSSGRSWLVPSPLLLALFCSLHVLSVHRLPALAQPLGFVSRSGDTLKLDGRPFYFLGANAYYLMESAARGDSTTVSSLFTTAGRLGLTVVRTWGFFDSSDSLNPAVIQFRPGAFNETALRALDYVVYRAKLASIRLIIPLVNSWDDYGGMNQYVRWRMQRARPATKRESDRFSIEEQTRSVTGPQGRSYRLALSPLLGHDDFYADSTIKDWYRVYVRTIFDRVNTLTGIQYRNEPTIMAWELANEPRSSDVTTRLVTAWVHEMASFVKSLDPNHLVGTGEEGVDNTPLVYSSGAYNYQNWLFDGSLGVSFSANTAVASIDFGSIHLYPESWNLPHSSGNAWIRDHINVAGAMRKPLVVGEFGVRDLKPQTYESWLGTALLDGAGGAAVWQLLDGRRFDQDGFGVRCDAEPATCEVLSRSAAEFLSKTRTGSVPRFDAVILLQNYPNPFNNQTTIAYTLPSPAHVKISMYNAAGQMVTTIVDGFQQPGLRRELFDAHAVASGAYFYRLSTGGAGSTKKLIIIK